MKEFLIFLWTFPQSFIGFILSRFCKKAVKFGKTVYVWSIKGSISLGLFVIVSKKALNNEFIIAHEYGHCKQSLYLSWLYLLVIGLPSFVWACLHRLPCFRRVCYYDFYTERWANKYAGYTAYLGAAGITYYEKV